jgi:Ca2+-binding RTX toxin-like protein
MAILDAPTYAFDQRLFNLYNPSFPEFTGDVRAKWVGKAYTPLGFIQPANYWSFLGLNLDEDSSGPVVTGIEIYFNPTAADILPDQLVWRWTPTFAQALYTVDLMAAIATPDNLDDTNLLADALLDADTFNLSGLNDYAIGYGGNDTMNGEAGNDTLMGHLGADLLSGGSGDDVFLYTDASHSTLSDMDTITDYARGDAIELRGSQGLDSALMLYQGSVIDTINYIYIFSFPTNTIYFFTDTTDWYAFVKGDGEGDDSRVSFDGTLIKISPTDTIDGETTTPFVLDAPVLTTEASYSLGDIQQAVTYIGNTNFGQTGTFEGVGNPLANTLIGGNGADTLFGLSGNDTLEGGLGSDRMHGGRGDDLYIVSDNDTLIELANEGIDEVHIANDDYTLPEHVENLELLQNETNSAISLLGNALDNRIIGSDSATNGEVISGGDGNDILYGRSGNDRLTGGSGSDSLFGGDGDDALEPNGGSDSVDGGEGNDTIFYVSGTHTINGGNGVDTLTLYLPIGADHLVADLIASTLRTFTRGGSIGDLSRVDQVENLTGTPLVDNYLFGNASDNVIIGGDFRDRLFGDAGNDTFYGGRGDDFISGEAGVDTIYESSGNDVYVVDNIEDRVIIGAYGLPGGTMDEIQARNCSYVLNQFDGLIENLRLVGEDASYAVGNSLSNYISGSESNNLLQGLAGNDFITGCAGHDTIEGGLGADVLRGDAGRDVFQFSSKNDSRLAAGSFDRILDYNLFEDEIEFVGMAGIELAVMSEFTPSSVASGIQIILANPIYANKAVAFFALDTWGTRDGYLYVNGAGTGTDYDGSVIRVSSALNGVVSDGYLSGALVWIDADDDGARDWTDSNRNGLWESGEGESWTLTDGQGRYSGLEGNGTLRVAANPNGTTIDISTGAVFTGSYAAPSGSSVISPLTTLLAASGDQQTIKEAFGLDEVDLTSFDPLAAATAADGHNAADAAAAIQMQSVNAQIANILAVATGMMTAAGASASSTSAIANAIAQNLATAASAGPVDLTSATVISSAIAAGSVGVLTSAQRAVVNAQLGAVSSAMAEVNNQIKLLSDEATTAASTVAVVDAEQYLRSIVGAQIVAQETLTEQARAAVLSNSSAGISINAGNITQLIIEAAVGNDGQILTLGASHRYEGSIDDISVAGIAADGNTLILKFADGEVVSLSMYSTDLNLAGVAYTTQQIVEQFSLRPAFTYFLNNATAYLLPELFAGDSSLGLLYQWIDTSPDAVIVGSNFGDFIVLQGTGNKAVDAAGGADVIDGGTGSTFVSGGVAGDADTFFLDGRASGVSWSTITDFELGRDKVTIWGWKEGVSKASVLFNDTDTGGAAGYTGLTLHFENLLPDSAPAGTLNANFNSVTLSGLTLAQFGASSITELNDQITNETNIHFIVGQTSDVYGEHGYLYIS